MRTKSSRSGEAAGARPRAPPPPGACPVRIAPSQTPRLGSRSSPPSQSTSPSRFASTRRFRSAPCSSVATRREPCAATTKRKIPKNCDRSAEKHAEGKRPAFVQSGENQKHEQKREPENGRRRNTFPRFLFLKGHPEVVKTHLTRHRFPENVFEGGHRLVCAVAGSSGAINLCRAILVESHREFRAIARLKSSDRSEGNHSAFVISHVELADIFWPRAIVAFSLDINLPLATEAIEVVDE